MDRKIWDREGFKLEAMPMWKCPFCDNDILRIQTKNQVRNFYYEETEVSKKLHDQLYWEDEYRFIGMLQCPRCKEIVSFCGEGRMAQFPLADENDQELGMELSVSFYPKNFTPAIHLFSIPERCPQEVRDPIVDSFNLFWVDYASCANKIRSVVESLLSCMNIRTISAARKYKPLRMRIEEYAKTNPEAGEMLSAIKWIGNAGSHNRPLKIDRTAILTAYEMLESVLIKLYDNNTEVAKIINENKGVL